MYGRSAWPSAPAPPRLPPPSPTGRCRRCKDERCERCDGDLFQCSQCEIPHVMWLEGLYPDPITGLWWGSKRLQADAAGRAGAGAGQPSFASAPAALPAVHPAARAPSPPQSRSHARPAPPCSKTCDAGCRACNGPGSCLECASTVLDPAKGTCPPCAVAGCRECPTSLEKCESCAAGFRQESDRCTACAANCKACNTTHCSECLPGYGLVLGECQRCAGADAGCANW